MHGRVLFEYAVVRVVPRVEREEFLNAGVVLYCKDRKWLDCRYGLNERRLNAFPEVDAAAVMAHLRSFQQIAKGEKNGSPIAKLDTASRFRWLTATRSTVIQTSKVHIGFCEDPEAALNDLFQKMVE